jgi:hypothetical protein
MRFGRQHSVGAIRNVYVATSSWFAQMDIDVQRVLAVGREVVSVRQLHVFLATVRCEQYALAPTKIAEVDMIGLSRHGVCAEQRHDCSCGQYCASPHTRLL